MGKSKGSGGLGLTALMKLGQQTMDTLKEGSEQSVLVDFDNEWTKVRSQLEHIDNLGKTVELPQDMELKIKKIRSDMEKMITFVRKAYGLSDDNQRKWSWTTYVPVAKPAIQTLGPAACVYLSMGQYLLVYIVVAVLIMLILLKLQKGLVVDFLKAWKGENDAKTYKHIKKLRQHYETLREFATFQNQLRRARTFDVRSILEENKAARVFWIRHFGANEHSVKTAQMIEALLHVNNQTHMVGKQMIELVYNTIANIIDKNNDGVISPIELLDFLKYFGPVKKCVTRIKESLIYEDNDGGPKRYPWFTWRSKDRQELESLMRQYGVDGDFVVRCSSRGEGTFAITFIIKGDIRSVLAFYSSNSHNPQGPFSIKDGKEGRRYYKNLALLVSDMGHILKQPFMDPETLVYFSISGKPFEVQASLFMQRSRKYAKTLLGEMFDPRPDETKFPRGKFWKSDVGHTSDNPIFLDRNPTAFNVILNWYRYDGKLYVPGNIAKELMAEEMTFFRLPFKPDYKVVGGVRSIADFVETKTA